MYFIVLIFSCFAKTIRFLSRFLGRGSGTSLPGLLVEVRAVWLLRYWNNKYKKKIFITGTNGKTTVRSLLNNFYVEAGYRTVTNLGGANIMRGIASTLLFDLNFFGRAKSDYLILEVEEATLPKLTKFIKPDQLIITNIFRDQLDAYGEIDQTLDYFVQAIKNSNPQIIINGDDQKLLSVLSEGDNVLYFGVDDNNKPKYESSSESKEVRKNLLARNIIFRDLRTSFDIYKDGKKQIVISGFGLSGVFNVYNFVAAYSALDYDFDLEVVKKVASRFQPVFGRGELINLGESGHRMFLVKNPAGFEQVLDLINQNYDKQKVNLIIAINDKIADGRDVSWLWDVDFESFFDKQKIGQLYTAGDRGLDMLLRLKYAGQAVKVSDNFETVNDLVDFLRNCNGDFIILSTYTAMREIRDDLSKYTQLPDIASNGN